MIGVPHITMGGPLWRWTGEEGMPWLALFRVNFPTAFELFPLKPWNIVPSKPSIPAPKTPFARPILEKARKSRFLAAVSY